jgi:hypothetical protein
MKEIQMNLQELKTEILADGVIDAAEVTKLSEAVYADGVIDKEEADILFELSDATSGKENAPEWKPFFIKAITDYVLADEATPGVVDEDEAAYIIEKVSGDAQIDELEQDLLRNIEKEATEVHASLTNFISTHMGAAEAEDVMTDEAPVEADESASAE